MEQIVYSPESLGQTIRRYRKLKKLNQEAAGEAFNIEQSTFSDIERGTKGTRLETLFRVLAALDLELIIRSKTTSSTKKGTW